MTHEVITALVTFATSAAGIAAWQGVGKVWGVWLQKRGEARLIEAEALKIRASGAVTEAQRHDEILAKVLADHADRMELMEARQGRTEQRVEKCEDERLECLERLGDLRAEFMGLVGQLDAARAENVRLEERVSRVERRTTPPGGIEAAVLRETEKKE